MYPLIKDIQLYSTLTGAFCLTEKDPLGYIGNKYTNYSINIQQCSLENIDACQHIFNQTLLFRLGSSAGFTSEINNIIRGFIYSINTRRKFLINDQYWNYGLFSSFFNMSQGHFSPWLPLSSYCLQRQFVHVNHYASNNKYIPEHITVGRDSNGNYSSLYWIMKPFEENNQTLKGRRIVAQYLWKTLNNETRDFIHLYLNKIQSDSIIYAIHIRRGDKLINEAKSIPLEKYIHGIEYFMKKHSQNGKFFFNKFKACILYEIINSKCRIYVGSDEPNVIDQLEDLRPAWEFVQILQPVLQSSGHQQEKFDYLSSSTKVELTRILITEIEVLSRVKYVVCTFSSNVCRFVQTLRKQEPDTVLSLDQEWFPQ